MELIVGFRVYVSVPFTNVLIPGFVLSMIVDWQALLGDV